MSVTYPPLNLPFPHNVYRGMTLPIFLKPERLVELKEKHKSKPGDVFIITFPKSGTTWLAYILYQLRKKPREELESLDKDVPWITTKSQADMDNISSPRIFRLHLLYDWLPESITRESKIIYCYRNPKDVAVSYYHHTKFFKGSYAGFQYEEFGEFFKDFTSKTACKYGRWVDHLLNWIPHSNQDNVLLLAYEDMVEDLPREVMKISKFLEIDTSKEKLAEIVNNSVFSAMKHDHRVNKKYLGEKVVDMKKDFIRKGKVGDWKDTLNAAQSQICDDWCCLLPSDLKMRFELPQSLDNE